MLTKDELKALVIKNQNGLRKNLGIQRNFVVKQHDSFATIISGVRRCGKSTLIKQYVETMSPVYYMHFEDVGLANFKLEEFERLDEVFQETLGKNGVYFFDEIQNIKGWEIFIRQLVDAGKKVLITGSNASMLSRDLGTRLTGRHLSYELYPFSFSEYIGLHKKKPSEKSFGQYLLDGGFPEYLKSKNPDILRTLFQDILYRDILVRNDIRNEASLKALLAYVSSNISKEVSYTKLKSVVDVGSVNTISQFIDAFESAYLFFAVKKYDASLKKQLMNPKKIYCIDNAFIQFNAFSTSPNLGRLLENTVFIELKRRNLEIFYYSNDGECDFVTRKDNAIQDIIQVCYDLHAENKEREIRGILKAAKEFSLKNALLLTYNQEDSLKIDGVTIHMKPVWKWLLE
ncbi:MAG: ATP-binding protein [Candidatus Woesearchaeota archaeon]